MTWDLLALLVLIIGAILLGGDYYSRKHAKAQRDWRSECDKALDRRRAELEMASLERFR